MPTGIKFLRIMHKDKQKDLADLIGCTLSTYNRKENGKADFTLNDIILIAKRYSVTIDYIVNFTGPKDIKSYA